MEILALYRFDEFTVDPVRRQICHAGAPLPVPQKVFQLLLFLLEHPGKVLTKREIMDAVWPQAFVEEANLTQSIFLLRKALGDQPNQNRYIVTIPGQGYQFAVQPVKVGSAPLEHDTPELATPHAKNEEGAEQASPWYVQPHSLTDAAATDQTSIEPERKGPRSHRWRLSLGLGAVLLLSGAAVTMIYLGGRPRPKIDGILVLAEFLNTTGEPAFDAALREGLAAQLEQSPNLGVLSDSRISQMMKLMAQPKGARLTSDLGREVCQRTGSVALIEGSIAKLGTQYVLGIVALNCHTGDILVQDQESANSKEQVLGALGVAAGKLRRKLGESLPSLSEHNRPPESVTTGSLEALEAYGLGMQAQNRGELPAAVAHYKRAISYDPLFAMAYARLGVCDPSQNGIESTRKAYLLRDRVSDREKFYLESHYEQYATGNLAAARKILEIWSEAYPYDGDPAPNLVKLYLTTGEYERALPLTKSIVRDSPGTPVINASRLATALLYLNRIGESKAVLLEAVKHHYDSPVHHYYLYEIYFLQNDSASMATEASYVRTQPGWNGNMLELEAASARYFGKFSLAHSLSDQAAQDALRDKNVEDAAGDLAESALQEALAENDQIARKQARAALAKSITPDIATLAGMAQALAGDRAGAAATLEIINHRFPENTLAQVSAVIIRACALLGKGKSTKDAHKALETLAAASPYAMSGNLSLVPVYVLGQAYLASGQNENAAAAFQNILDHYGVTRNYVTGPVARLGLARAEEQAGEIRKSKNDYDTFVQIWRDSDRHLPLLKSAQASLKRLNQSKDGLN